MQQSHGQPDVYSYRNDGSADRGHRPNRGHDTRNRRQYPTVEYGEGRPAGHMEIPVNDHDRGGRYRKSPEFRARSSSIIDRDFDGDQQENEDMMTDEDEVVSDSEVFVKPQDREEDRRLRAIYGERLRLMSPGMFVLHSNAARRSCCLLVNTANSAKQMIMLMLVSAPNHLESCA